MSEKETDRKSANAGSRSVFLVALLERSHTITEKEVERTDGMNDQKIENLLNLALDTPQAEREKSELLEVGYQATARTWQVIVRYSGDLAGAAKAAAGERWKIIELSGGYAIVTLPERDLSVLADLNEVEYIEKPKRLYFSVDQGRQASCISAVQSGTDGLDGEGVLVAVIDSGVDYFHPDFRNADGTTRILTMWDQSAEAGKNKRNDPEDTWREEKEITSRIQENMEQPERGGQGSGIQFGRTPDGFTQGVEYTRAEIDAALAAGSRQEGLALVPEEDVSGHGTEVLGIAAGNGQSSGGRYRGVAPQAELIVVKLGTPEPGGFPRTTELMQAIEYVVRKAEELRRPVAVNLSFGNVYGSHRGNTLLETYLDQMANRWKSVFVIGMGNEAATDGHVSGKLEQNGPEQVIEFTIGEQETSLGIQLWKNYADTYRITVIDPEGRSVGPFGSETGAAKYRNGGTTLLIYYGEPAPYQGQQEIFMEWIPVDDYLDSGIWRIVLTPGKITDGSYNLWMSDGRARGRYTRFLRPSPEATLTIPAAASRAVAVGAYDSRTNAYATFSGRGWPGEIYGVRPDLVAPGVQITATAPGGSYRTVTGTSFAAPFVTGSAALLMQWGIVRENDPFLYGEKVRAYLRKGARPLPGFTVYPNEKVGYGALCAAQSIPL